MKNNHSSTWPVHSNMLVSFSTFCFTLKSILFEICGLLALVSFLPLAFFIGCFHLYPYFWSFASPLFCNSHLIFVVFSLFVFSHLGAGPTFEPISEQM